MRHAEGTSTFTIELPQGVLSHLAPTPEQVSKALLLAAAIELYREGRISQGQGALIAGMSRAQFLDELFRAKVPACQVTVDELVEEVDRRRIGE
jgi:predicted HTH domain antitoxin